MTTSAPQPENDSQHIEHVSVSTCPHTLTTLQHALMTPCQHIGNTSACEHDEVLSVSKINTSDDSMCGSLMD